ncbi:MAG: FtsX-like permease family protein, partial [Psychrosphaera sp.]|nr:FtsX-like permease family protein [Psychrosphaera sp.]
MLSSSLLTSSLLQRVLLIWWTLFGHYRKHPAQGLFLLLGLSLGVAILLGTLIVSSVAKTSFASAQQVVGGSVVATIQPINGKRSLPQSTYVTLRRNGFTDLMPMVEGRLRLKEGGSISLQGIDAFALAHSTSSDTNPDEIDNKGKSTGIGGFGQGDFSMLAFSFPPYQTLISTTQAKQRNLKDGDILTLASGKNLPAIKIVSDSLGTGYSLMCDLACAQQMLALPDQLTSIALTAQTDDVEQLKALLSEDTDLRFPSKNAQNAALSDAFFLNLTAVSFLAFLVGCFIAFNAVRFSVRQRLNMVQQLRLVGVTFGEIAMALMMELLSWALLASLLGCLLGWLIASALLPGVSLTLVRLFQGQNPLFIEQVTHWWPLALMVSLTATLVATAQPFWQLAKEQPLQSRQVTRSKDQMGYSGIALLALGGLLTLMPHSQPLGFAIAACW